MFSVVLAAIAGITDWRWRRIPNWLTVTGFLAGFASNAAFFGWAGVKASLLGAGLGLGLLLPFVLVRSLGAGDWKLIGALGAWLGPGRLISVLFATVLIAGIMALVLIIQKRRVRQTARNMGHMLAAFASLHLPGKELTLDDPHAAKVPFGVAVAFAVVLYVGGAAWRHF
jgi:prepilin peptidase CpaA